VLRQSFFGLFRCNSQINCIPYPFWLVWTFFGYSLDSSVEGAKPFVSLVELIPPDTAELTHALETLTLIIAGIHFRPLKESLVCPNVALPFKT
jgi:hypothetical protein